MPVSSAQHEQYAIALQRLASQCEANAASVRRGAYPRYPHDRIEAVRAALEALLLELATGDARVTQRDAVQ